MRKTDEQISAEIMAFVQVWPNAEHGPAHVVIADANYNPATEAWCEGIIYAVQEGRKAGLVDIYADHSDAEIEATRLLLMWIGGTVFEVIHDARTGNVKLLGWRDVARDAERSTGL